MMRKIGSPQYLLLGTLLFIILILYLVAFQVRVDETAVVTTFGKPVRVITSPGLYWKAPWPIQEVYRFDSRIQVLEGKMEEVFTKDGKNIILVTSTLWRIKDPLKFFVSVGGVDEAKKKLSALVRNYVNGIIGTYQLSHLVNVKKEELKFDEIQSKITQLARVESEKTYGITIEDVLIKRLQFPQDVTEDVFERMRKERERIAEKYIAEGEGLASDIKAKADAEKERILAEAKAKAKRIRGEGDAEAAKYYDVFTKNEDLAIFLRKLEALENTLKEKSTVILDYRTPPYDLFLGKYLETSSSEETLKGEEKDKNAR
ncbi:MAG TPA: protease modulator HflC [bacterium]|nr:protease modulator HflC [bacterium]HEX68379.1 protease modulator HflC [bacterium]